MPAFRNQIEEAAWRETWCAKCFQPDEAIKRVTGNGDGCPLLIVADRGRTPSQWTKRRNAVMGDTYKCSEFRKQPDSIRRKTNNATQDALFDIEPHDTPPLVPVAGWPDYRPRKTKESDHQ